MPNAQGVQIDNGSTNNTIGGTTASAGNVIDFNTSFGVSAGVSPSDSSTGNQILYDTIDSNTGGGVDNDSRGLLTIANTTIASNSTTGNGGGIVNVSTGTVLVSSSTISSNTAPSYGFGGGIYNAGTMTLSSRTALDGNSAGDGGGIYNATGAELSIEGSSILMSNSADAYGAGGGIWNDGTLAVTDSTIEDNLATQFGYGGGILNDDQGTLTVTDSTLTGNQAYNDGGGIWTGGGATINDSTLSVNSGRRRGRRHRKRQWHDDRQRQHLLVEYGRYGDRHQ